MKKLYSLFLGYMTFLSVGFAFLWELFGFALGFAIDDYLVLRQHPRYFPFCIVGGGIAFIGFLTAVSMNFKISKKITISKTQWVLFFAAVILISIIIAIGWVNLFRFIQYKI